MSKQATATVTTTADYRATAQAVRAFLGDAASAAALLTQTFRAALESLAIHGTRNRLQALADAAAPALTQAKPGRRLAALHAALQTAGVTTVAGVARVESIKPGTHPKDRATATLLDELAEQFALSLATILTAKVDKPAPTHSDKVALAVKGAAALGKLGEDVLREALATPGAAADLLALIERISPDIRAAQEAARVALASAATARAMVADATAGTGDDDDAGAVDAGAVDAGAVDAVALAE